MRRFREGVTLAVVLLWGGPVRAAVSVTKIPTPPVLSAGDVASFQYLITNGATIAQNVTLTDPLPAGVSWTENSTACSIDGTGLLTCSFGTLPASFQAVLVTTTGLTDYADCGSLSSTATITSSTGGSTSLGTVVVLCPSVSGFVFADTFVPGAPLGITVAAVNGGPGIARSVSIALALDLPGVSFTREPEDGRFECFVTGGTSSCELGDLAPGAGGSYRIASTSTTEAACDLTKLGVLSITVGNEPKPPCCGSTLLLPHFTKVADADGNCQVNVSDVLYLINFLFASGPAPVEP